MHHVVVGVGDEEGQGAGARVLVGPGRGLQELPLPFGAGVPRERRGGEEELVPIAHRVDDGARRGELGRRERRHQRLEEEGPLLRIADLAGELEHRWRDGRLDDRGERGQDPDPAPLGDRGGRVQRLLEERHPRRRLQGRAERGHRSRPRLDVADLPHPPGGEPEEVGACVLADGRSERRRGLGEEPVVRGVPHEREGGIQPLTGQVRGEAAERAGAPRPVRGHDREHIGEHLRQLREAPHDVRAPPLVVDVGGDPEHRVDRDVPLLAAQLADEPGQRLGARGRILDGLGEGERLVDRADGREPAGERPLAPGPGERVRERSDRRGERRPDAVRVQQRQQRLECRFAEEGPGRRAVLERLRDQRRALGRTGVRGGTCERGHARVSVVGPSRDRQGIGRAARRRQRFGQVGEPGRRAGGVTRGRERLVHDGMPLGFR